MLMIMDRVRSFAAVGALVFGLALLAAGLTISTGSASESATPEAYGGKGIGDGLFEDTPEGRARYGSIFLGTVLRETGQETSPVSDGSVLTDLLYEVEVEQTLRGEARGVVIVYYTALDFIAPDFREAARLRPGDRALFFGGYSPEEDLYPVSATYGLVRVTSDQEAAELIAFYEPLIREDERRERQKAPPSPCNTPDRDAGVTLSATQGKAGDDIHLIGGPFPRAEVGVYWDDPRSETTAVPVGEDCQADGVVTVPDLAPGHHELVVLDALDREVRITFAVVGGE